MGSSSIGRSSRSEINQIHLLRLLLRPIATGYDLLLLPIVERP